MATPPMNMPPPGMPQRQTWWSRNWKWFVPTGCLTIIALGVAFVAVIVLVVFGAMKSSDAYKMALARAKADPRVIEAIGTPIKEGMLVSGNTHVDGASGNADLSIPISGPKGKATIYAAATKFAGKWTYDKLVVQPASGDQIDLLENSENAP